MIIPIELRFEVNKDSKSAFRTDKTIKSHDVNSVEFHISIDGLELTDNYTAKILSVFHSSKSQVNMDCEIVAGKIIYKPDTNLISRHEHVTNYVYVYNDNQSLDVREFIYTVDLSKIDETSLEVKEVYDQSYADLLAEFERALEDYKSTLPQASELRAEIDVILNQFGVDSQRVIGDLVEVTATAEIAEASRVQAESERVQAETERKEAETLREDNYEQLIDTALIEADVVEKVDNKVTELTPRMNELTAQLAQTESNLLNLQISDFEYDELNYPTTPLEFPSIKPPFRVYRDVDNKIKHDFVFDVIEEGAGHVYVKGYGGSDLNGGLVKESPVALIPTAFNIANQLPQETVVIHLLDNLIDDSRFNATFDFTLKKNIVLKSESTSGMTFIHAGHRPSSGTWTPEGLAYKKNVSTLPLEVVDASSVIKGSVRRYKKVNSVSEVQNEKGSWYYTGTELYVRRYNDLVPTSDGDNIAIVYKKNYQFRVNTSGKKLFLRNVEVNAIGLQGDALQVRDNDLQGELYTENCVFSGSQNRNGIGTVGVLKTYHFNSMAFNNYLDGFNYHALSISKDTRNYAFEYQCKSHDNGVEGVSNANASTAHEGYTILRIEGEYHDTYGPVIADVHSCFTVIYDSVSYNSLRSLADTKAAFYFSNAGGAKEGVAYLINSAGGGNGTFSISADPTLPVYINQHKGREFYENTDITVY